MKKAVLKSTALLSSVIVSGAALAQATNVDPAAKKEDAAKTVIPYGLFQSYVNFYDSQRQNTPDFNTLTARFGLKVTEGIVRGQLETQVRGNDKSSPAADNGINLRRADVGLAFPTDTTVFFGRVRPGGADGWGVDASATPDNYGASDGVLIVQKVALSDADSVELKLGAFNNMGVLSGKDFTARDVSKSQDRALHAGFNATVAGVKAAAHYQWQANNVSALEAEAKPAVGTTPATPATPETVSDKAHLEASLGYEMDGIAAGAWYEQLSQGKTRTVTKNEGGKKSFGPKTGNESSVSVIGLGVNGDSSLFGVTDVIMKGDKFIYGASFAIKQAEGDNQAAKDAAIALATGVASAVAPVANSQNEIAVGAGYAAGGAIFELDFVNRQAKTAGFANEKGEPSKKKSSNEVYLTAIYSF